MSPTSWIVLGWLAFAITHMLLAERRENLIHSLGSRLYIVVYSGVAFACFIPLVWVYINNRHAGELLFIAPSWLQHIGMGLSLLGISIIPAAVLRSSPVGMIPRPPEATGLLRITRHPLFMSLGLWGLGHCLINNFQTDILFFGGFAVFAVIGCAHQDRRKQKEQDGQLEAFFAETSLLPFVAIASGRNRLVANELPWLWMGVGAGLAFFLYWLHPLVFG